MYTLDLPILYSEEAQAVEIISGQHQKCFHICRARKRRYAVRFLLWWLFLHRRLRSRQRGSSAIKQRAAWLPNWLYLSKRGCSFLSEQLKKSKDFFQASLSASIQGVNSSEIRILLLSNKASPQ